MCMQKQAMGFSITTVQLTARSKQWMAGKRYLPSLGNTYRDGAPDRTTSKARCTMCTMIVEHAEISGSGMGPTGWFAIGKANVSYDHPYHAQAEYSINIDFVDNATELNGRVAVELTPDSARNLVSAIEMALARGLPYNTPQQGTVAPQN